jgi:anti-sigma factor RsiW
MRLALWRRGELVCQEMVELITDYLEGALSRSQRRRFEAHIAGCEHCAEYLEQMRATIRLTGRLRAEDLAPEMHEEFADIYLRWRSEED